MKKFRVYATYQVTVYADVEAENSQAAREIAKEMDGGDFKECVLGDWNIEPNPEEIGDCHD